MIDQLHAEKRDKEGKAEEYEIGRSERRAQLTKLPCAKIPPNYSLFLLLLFPSN